MKPERVLALVKQAKDAKRPAPYDFPYLPTEESQQLLADLIEHLESGKVLTGQQIYDASRCIDYYRVCLYNGIETFDREVDDELEALIDHLEALAKGAAAC